MKKDITSIAGWYVLTKSGYPNYGPFFNETGARNMLDMMKDKFGRILANRIKYLSEAEYYNRLHNNQP